MVSVHGQVDRWAKCEWEPGYRGLNGMSGKSREKQEARRRRSKLCFCRATVITELEGQGKREGEAERVWLELYLSILGGEERVRKQQGILWSYPTVQRLWEWHVPGKQNKIKQITEAPFGQRDRRWVDTAEENVQEGSWASLRALQIWSHSCSGTMGKCERSSVEEGWEGQTSVSRAVVYILKWEI